MWAEESHNHILGIREDYVSLSIQLQYNIVCIRTQPKLEDNDLEPIAKSIF